MYQLGSVYAIGIRLYRAEHLLQMLCACVALCMSWSSLRGVGRGSSAVTTLACRTDPENMWQQARPLQAAVSIPNKSNATYYQEN